MFKDVTKTKDLMLRVYNNKMVKDETPELDDETAIKKLCEKVFGDGSVTPDPTTLHNFNNIVTKVADEVAKPDVEKLLNYFAKWQTYPADTQLIEYKKPHPVWLKFKWTAIGSNVALKRVEAGDVDYIKVTHIQTGISYNPLTQNSACVENFQALVNDIASAKVRLVYETIMKMMTKAIEDQVIPTNNVLDGASTTLAGFDKVANTVARRNGARPLFVADRDLISYYANLITTGTSILLTDGIKNDIYSYELTKLRSCDAIPLENRFMDYANTKTEFPRNRGYLLGSLSNTAKPFEVGLVGGLVQHTENNFIDGRVKMIIRQGIGIDLLCGNAIGVIEEDTVTV